MELSQTSFKKITTLASLLFVSMQINVRPTASHANHAARTLTVGLKRSLSAQQKMKLCMCVIRIHVRQCRGYTEKLLQRPMQRSSSSPPPLRLLLTLLAYPGWPVGVPLHFSEDQVSGLEVVWHCVAPQCSLDLKSNQLRSLSVSLFVCFFFRSTRNLETMGLASKLTAY